MKQAITAGAQGFAPAVLVVSVETRYRSFFKLLLPGSFMIYFHRNKTEIMVYFHDENDTSGHGIG